MKYNELVVGDVCLFSKNRYIGIKTKTGILAVDQSDSENNSENGILSNYLDPCTMQSFSEDELDNYVFIKPDKRTSDFFKYSLTSAGYVILDDGTVTTKTFYMDINFPPFSQILGFKVVSFDECSFFGSVSLDIIKDYDPLDSNARPYVGVSGDRYNFVMKVTDETLDTYFEYKKKVIISNIKKTNNFRLGIDDILTERLE